jgi:hypothetical protein
MDANIAFMNLTKNTEQAALVASIPGFKYRRNLLVSCTRHGSLRAQRLGNAASLATLQANKIYMLNSAAKRGIKVTTATNFPATTSTDGWTSAGAQTVIAGESVHVALNDWIRDGAPILNGVVVANGSSAPGPPQTRMSRHPMIGYHELAGRRQDCT